MIDENECKFQEMRFLEEVSSSESGLFSVKYLLIYSEKTSVGNFFFKKGCKDLREISGGRSLGSSH